MTIDELKERIKLYNHLQYNHYPGLGYFLDQAKEAIQAVDSGSPDELISLEGS